MLSVLPRYTDSDCPFGIFKLFLCTIPQTIESAGLRNTFGFTGVSIRNYHIYSYLIQALNPSMDDDVVVVMPID